MNRIRDKVVDAVARLTVQRCEYGFLYTRPVTFAACIIMIGTAVSTGARCSRWLDNCHSSTGTNYFAAMGAVAKYCNEHVCVYICLSASLSQEPHGRSLPTFYACCLWPWLGSHLAGWQNSKGKGNFQGFLPHWQCIVKHSIWGPYKNDSTDRHAVCFFLVFWYDDSGGPWVPCVRWRFANNVVQQKGSFNMPDKRK